MNRPSNVEKILLQKAETDTAIIVLLQGDGGDGKPAYVYLAVPTSKYIAFVEAYRAGRVALQDWGVVVESGYGEPSEAVKARMADEYDFKHDSPLIDPQL
jgi:hypothetical protein